MAKYLPVNAEFWWPSGLTKPGQVRKMKDSIIRSFKKCGLSVALDGLEDDQVNIEGILNYQMPKAFGEDEHFTLL